MAGGTKRLPRAVREQQMLDAAVEMFSINGYHDTSMDAIAAKAEISKPMLYLYYGSKEELFGACLDRELARFIDGVREDINLDQSPRDLLHNTIVAFMRYIDSNRASWIVMYAQATNSQAFAHTVREGRERIIALVVRVLQAGTRNPEPDTDFEMIAVALVGAGEAIATRLSTGDTDVDGAAEVMINLFWRGLKGKPVEQRRGRTLHRIRLIGLMDRRNADFFCAVVIVGLLAGVAGLSTTLLLRCPRTSHLSLHLRIIVGGGDRQQPGPSSPGADGRRSACRAGVVATAVADRCAVVVRGHRGPEAYSSAALQFRRGAAGIGRRLRCVAGPGSGPAPIRGGPRRFRYGMAETAVGTGPRDPAGLCGRRRIRCGVCGAARWCAVRPADHVEDLASPRGGCCVDHLQPGGRSCLVRHP